MMDIWDENAPFQFNGSTILLPDNFTIDNETGKASIHIISVLLSVLNNCESRCLIAVFFL